MSDATVNATAAAAAEASDSVAAGAPLISLDHVTVEFGRGKNRFRAVDDVSLTINKGSIYGIIGFSGAGKSTLVRTMNVLQRPTSGTVTFNGTTISTLGEGRLLPLRRKIAMIFQHFNLLSSRTVYDNVALPLELAGVSRDKIREKVTPLLELVGLTEHAKKYPAQLSGGQKQRVGIARALANDPTVLLSDEATSALDPETTTSTLALLRKINKELGVTIVMITHQMEVVKQICERIVVMDHGEVIEEGSVLDVFRNPRHPTTRSMLSGILCTELPAQVVQHIRDIFKAHPNDCNKALRITFVGEEATEPVIATCATRYGVNFNILAGQISEIQESTFSSLTVVCSCSQEAYDRVREYLISNNIQIEELNDAVNA